MTSRTDSKSSIKSRALKMINAQTRMDTRYNNARFHHKHTEDIPIALAPLHLWTPTLLARRPKVAITNKHIVHNSDKEDMSKAQKAIDN